MFNYNPPAFVILEFTKLTLPDVEVGACLVINNVVYEVWDITVDKHQLRLVQVK